MTIADQYQKYSGFTDNFVGISELYANDVDHTGPRVLRRLSWVYTVCLCPFLWEAGLELVDEANSGH